MGTNRLHPSVRKSEQDRKKLIRQWKGKIPHHTRKWWKAWENTWNAKYKEQNA